MSDEKKYDPLADTDVFEGFAPIKHEGPIRGLRTTDDVTIDEVPATPKADEETIYRATRLYHKTQGVSVEAARELMENDHDLARQWAKK